MMRTFKEFLQAQKESTAAKRAKNAGFLGLAVAGPEAGFNGGATANPGLLDYYKKCVKGNGKCKPTLKVGKQPQVSEALNHGIDKWLDSVDKLKKDLDSVPQDDERVDDLEDGGGEEERVDDLEDGEEEDDLEDGDGEEEDLDDLEGDEDLGDEEPEHEPKFHKHVPDNGDETLPHPDEDEEEDEEDEDIPAPKGKKPFDMPEKPGFEEWVKMFSDWSQQT